MSSELNRDENRTRNEIYWTVTAMRWEDQGSEAESWIGEEIESYLALNRGLALKTARELLERHIDVATADYALQVSVNPPNVPAHEPGAFHVFDVPPHIVKEAERLGIDGETRARVREMARLSAPFSKSPQMNRRFKDFLFRIEKDAVVQIDMVEPSKRRR